MAWFAPWPHPRRRGARVRRAARRGAGAASSSSRRELGATELALRDAARRARGAGRRHPRRRRAVLATYREPLGGHALMLAALPIDQVVPTPFQRDISDAHVRRLTQAMDKTKRFLDPIIVVREQTESAAVLDAERLPPADGAQGAGREERARAGRARARGRLPDPGAQHREGPQPAREGDRRAAHVRGPGGRSPDAKEDETAYALEFEEPALATLGFAYEERGRLSGGAYHPILRKVDSGCRAGSPTRSTCARARRRCCSPSTRRSPRRSTALKARGLQQPLPAQLRRRARQPAALHQGRAAAARRAPAVDDQARARHDADKIKTEDVARSGGAPEASE